MLTTSRIRDGIFACPADEKLGQSSPGEEGSGRNRPANLCRVAVVSFAKSEMVVSLARGGDRQGQAEVADTSESVKATGATSDYFAEGASAVVKQDEALTNNIRYEYLDTASEDSLTLLGEHKLGKLLGKGTSGEVRLATHVQTGERAAVKIIKKRDGRRELPLPKEELRCLRSLRHDNIVRLISVVDTPRNLYLAMEYCDTDMLSFLNTCPVWLTEMTAARFFDQTLQGVRFCHGLGVCHRDLKLENLLLCGSTIKIADFGLSKFVDEQNRLESYAGSPQYLAPELVDEVVTFDGCAADMWSCGVVLYALLFRGLPFDAPSLEDILANIVLGKYKLTRPVSAEASALLASLLNADPPKRLTAADALEAAWIVANREGPADQALTGGGIAEATPRGVAMRGSKAVSTDTMLSNVAQKLQLKRKAEEAGIRMPSIPSALPSRLERRTQDDALPPSQSRRLYRLDPAPALLERS